MYDTDYENGVLVCNIHRTPINKSHGRFFCLKCQREEADNKTTKKYAVPLTEWNKLVEQKIKLEKALDYAKSFIDGYGAARIEEGLGREGMDAVLKEINKIAEPKLCICCEEITEENAHLHRNCGK